MTEEKLFEETMEQAKEAFTEVTDMENQKREEVLAKVKKVAKIGLIGLGVVAAGAVLVKIGSKNTEEIIEGTFEVIDEVGE